MGSANRMKFPRWVGSKPVAGWDVMLGVARLAIHELKAQ
jgi:hypothetical protein